jgi:hypothetical protein
MASYQRAHSYVFFHVGRYVHETHEHITGQKFAMEYVQQRIYVSLELTSVGCSITFVKTPMPLLRALCWNKGRPSVVSHVSCPGRPAADTDDSYLDAHGDILRGLQVVESACAIPTSLMGSKLEGMPSTSCVWVILTSFSVSKDMDTYTRRLPLGVCAR